MYTYRPSCVCRKKLDANVARIRHTTRPTHIDGLHTRSNTPNRGPKQDMRKKHHTHAHMNVGHSERGLSDESRLTTESLPARAAPGAKGSRLASPRATTTVSGRASPKRGGPRGAARRGERTFSFVRSSRVSRRVCRRARPRGSVGRVGSVSVSDGRVRGIAGRCRGACPRTNERLTTTTRRARGDRTERNRTRVNLFFYLCLAVAGRSVDRSRATSSMGIHRIMSLSRAGRDAPGKKVGWMDATVRRTRARDACVRARDERMRGNIYASSLCASRRGVGGWGRGLDVDRGGRRARGRSHPSIHSLIHPPGRFGKTTLGRIGFLTTRLTRGGGG